MNKNRTPRRPIQEILTREAAWKIVEPYAAQLHTWLLEAFDWTQELLNGDADRRACFESGTVASIVYDRFKWLMKNGLDGDKRILFVQQGRMTSAAVDRTMVLRMKKLDARLLSHNIPTENQDQIYYQQLRLEGVGERPTYVTLGYQTTITGTKIRRVCIVCPLGPRRNHWHIVLSDTEGDDGYLFNPHGFNDGLPPPDLGGQRKVDDA